MSMINSFSKNFFFSSKQQTGVRYMVLSLDDILWYHIRITLVRILNSYSFGLVLASWQHNYRYENIKWWKWKDKCFVYIMTCKVCMFHTVATYEALISFVSFWLIGFRWRRATDISSYHNLSVFPAVDVAWSLILIIHLIKYTITNTHHKINSYIIDYCVKTYVEY